MPLGIYISVPFCRSKCSFCNFASGVFSREKMSRYTERVCGDIAAASSHVRQIGARLEASADTLYLGGGTPSTLDPILLHEIFRAVRDNFDLRPESEITVECAPSTLSSAFIDAMLANGVDRVSLGVQSLIDKEAASVGRLHTRAQVFDDVTRLRSAGIANINIDLIAGLPYQTAASWRESLKQVSGLAVPHVSVYILEIDEDSRLGVELIAGGAKYHAHHVPDADLAADLYLEAIEFLNDNGTSQYEISNFARPGWESRHNLKYWTRQPYIGFGLDAHSMLPASTPSEAASAMRFSTPDELETYISGTHEAETISVTRGQALEEAMFLGLRLNRGVDPLQIRRELGIDPLETFAAQIAELTELGLLTQSEGSLRLTAKGRLLSNEVFERFIFERAPEGVSA